MRRCQSYTQVNVVQTVRYYHMYNITRTNRVRAHYTVIYIKQENLVIDVDCMYHVSDDRVFIHRPLSSLPTQPVRHA